MKRAEDSRSAVTTTRAHIGEWGTAGLKGYVVTWDGIVHVWGTAGSSTYLFVLEGVAYWRTERRRRTARGLAIMAGKFAREITEPVYAQRLAQGQR